MLRFRDVDLNLLIVFQLIYSHRNLGQVAEKLGITQPAVSNCLSRLRKQLKDELFERTPQGLSPTPYADKISDVVESGLLALEYGLEVSSDFDPLSSDRKFRIAMSEIFELLILPRLIQLLNAIAPSVRIHSVKSVGTTLKTDIEGGDIDLAIGFYPQLTTGFYQRGLHEEQYVCLMRDGHPMLDGEHSLERLAGFEHLIVDALDSGHRGLEKRLMQSGVGLTSKYRVPGFLTAPHLIADSDIIATLPKRFAEMAAHQYGLSLIDHPVELESYWVRIFWHKRFHRDQGLIWLRKVIADLYLDPSLFREPL